MPDGGRGERKSQGEVGVLFRREKESGPPRKEPIRKGRNGGKRLMKSVGEERVEEARQAVTRCLCSRTHGKGGSVKQLIEKGK